MKCKYKIITFFGLLCIISCGRNSENITENEIVNSIKQTMTENENIISGAENKAIIGTRWIIAFNGLRIREGAETNSGIIDVIPYGSEVSLLNEIDESETISGHIGKWSNVLWGEITGWVFGGYLSDKQPAYNKIKIQPPENFNTSDQRLKYYFETAYLSRFEQNSEKEIIEMWGKPGNVTTRYIDNMYSEIDDIIYSYRYDTLVFEIREVVELGYNLKGDVLVEYDPDNIWNINTGTALADIERIFGKTTDIRVNDYDYKYPVTYYVYNYPGTEEDRLYWIGLMFQIEEGIVEKIIWIQWQV